MPGEGTDDADAVEDKGTRYTEVTFVCHDCAFEMVISMLSGYMATPTMRKLFESHTCASALVEGHNSSGVDGNGYSVTFDAFYTNTPGGLRRVDGNIFPYD